MLARPGLAAPTRFLLLSFSRCGTPPSPRRLRDQTKFVSASVGRVLRARQPSTQPQPSERRAGRSRGVGRAPSPRPRPTMGASARSLRLALGLLLLGTLLRPADACSCSPVHPQQAFCNADIGKDVHPAPARVPTSPAGAPPASILHWEPSGRPPPSPWRPGNLLQVDAKIALSSLLPPPLPPRPFFSSLWRCFPTSKFHRNSAAAPAPAPVKGARNELGFWQAEGPGMPALGWGGGLARGHDVEVCVRMGGEGKGTGNPRKKLSQVECQLGVSGHGVTWRRASVPGPLPSAPFGGSPD